MTMAPLFADISKGPKDLLADDFGTKMTVKAKVPAGPAVLTLETERKSSSLSSKVSVKLASSTILPKGFSLDKFQMKPDGGNALETSLTGAAPGLKLTFKGNDGGAGDLGVEYKKGTLAASAVLDVVDLSKVSTSACFGVGASSNIGGCASYSMSGKECALSSYSLGGSYSSGALSVSAATGAKISDVNLYTLYKVKPALTVATSTSHSADKPFGKFEVGCSYGGFAKVGVAKAKVNCDGLVSGAIVKKVDNYTVTAGATVSSADLSTFKWGVGVSL